MELHFERINREERTSTLGTRARHSHIRNGNENAPYGIGGIGLRSVPSPRFFVVVCLHSDVILIYPLRDHLLSISFVIREYLRRPLTAISLAKFVRSSDLMHDIAASVDYMTNDDAALAPRWLETK
jgi:hypothetical protein